MPLLCLDTDTEEPTSMIVTSHPSGVCWSVGGWGPVSVLALFGKGHPATKTAPIISSGIFTFPSHCWRLLSEKDMVGWC